MKNHKIIAISGGSSGIGHAIAKSLLSAGGFVSISGRNRSRIHNFCNRDSDYTSRVCGVVSDAADVNHVPNIFKESRRVFGNPPTAFILCAGRGLPGSLLKSDPLLWEELLRVNLLGAMRQLRACTEAFIDDAPEHHTPIRDIIIIGSTVGRTLSSNNPVYGSTKCALHYLTESLRQDLCEHKIRVTLIEPGFVKTEFQKNAGYNMHWFEQLEAEQGPFLIASDIADVVYFVLEQPPHVHVDDVRVRPTRQRV